MISLIINILIIAGLIAVLRKLAREKPLESFFWPGLIIKVVAGIAVGLVYKHYYKVEGDTYTLFNLAAYLASLAGSNFDNFLNIILYNEFDTGSKTFFFIWNQPRSLLFVKIVSIINLISDNNYWITSIYLSIFSFYGCWRVSNLLVKEFKVEKRSAALSFLLFPSLVFWSSGVLKEAIMLGAICFMVSAVIEIIKKTRIPLNVIALILSALVLWFLKYYYAVIVFAVLAAYFLVTVFFKTKLLKLIGLPAIIVIGIVLTATLHPNLVFSNFPGAIYQNYTSIVKAAGSPDFHFDSLTASWGSIIENLPKAFITGILRPFPWEASANFQVVAAIENFFILLMSLSAIAFIIYQKKNILSVELGACFLFVLIMSTFLALSTPNYGTLLRYKTGYMPFLLLLITNRNPLFDFFFSGPEIGRKAG